MRTRINENGIVEGLCRHCNTWKVIGHREHGTHSPMRNVYGDASWYWNSTRGEYKTMCKACEAERKRQRRANGASPRPTGRGFGIEMELTGPSAQHVIDALLAHGIPMDSRNESTRREIGYSATNTRAHVWTLKHDGSVRGYGLELVSPVLRGTAGMEELATVCAALNSVGATVDRSTGLHVHHDFRNLTADQVRRQCLMFVERQDLIAELVAPSRRGNHYCPSWTEHNIDALRHATTLSQMQYVGPRGNLNLSSYARHGSVEIRFHGGSTNSRKILAWLRFGQALFAAGEAGASVSTETPESMLFDLRPFGLSAADAATLLRFRRFGTTPDEIRAAATEASELLTEVA